MTTASLTPREKIERLDPIQITYTNEFYLLENLTTRLISLSENGDYKPLLASKIQRTSPTIYEFKIQESKFSNGDLVTLNDVEGSFQRVMKNGSSHTTPKEIIKSIRIKNDSLVIELFKPTKSFLYYLSLPDFGILHRNQYTKPALSAGDFTDISSGPFFLSYMENGNVQLIKNQHYKLSKVNYPEIINLKRPSSNLIKEIKDNQIHVGEISLNDLLSNHALIKENSQLRVLGSPTDSLTYLMFNPRNKKYSLKTRQWIFKKIIDSFHIAPTYVGLARKTNQYFPPESKAALNEDVIGNFLPPELGSDNNIPEEIKGGIKIHTYKSAFNVTPEPLVRKALESIGVPVEILNDVETKDYLQFKESDQFEIFLQITSTDFRVPMEAINFEYFSDISALKDVTGNIKLNFDKYQFSDDPQEEMRALQEISKQILTDLHVIPLFHCAAPTFYNEKYIDANKLSHAFIFNFWTIEKI